MSLSTALFLEEAGSCNSGVHCTCWHTLGVSPSAQERRGEETQKQRLLGYLAHFLIGLSATDIFWTLTALNRWFVSIFPIL